MLAARQPRKSNAGRCFAANVSSIVELNTREPVSKAYSKRAGVRFFADIDRRWSKVAVAVPAFVLLIAVATLIPLFLLEYSRPRQDADRERTQEEEPQTS